MEIIIIYNTMMYVRLLIIIIIKIISPTFSLNINSTNGPKIMNVRVENTLQ